MWWLGGGGFEYPSGGGGGEHMTGHVVQSLMHSKPGSADVSVPNMKITFKSNTNHFVLRYVMSFAGSICSSVA